MSTPQERRQRLTFGGNVKRALCGLCSARCGMLVKVEDGQPVRFIGDRENPTAAGRLCIKATPALELHDHPDRVNHVMKRVGRRGEGRWARIDWEQAMDEIAHQLESIRDHEGPEALATFGGSKHSPGDWAGWRFVCQWGTPNLINQGRNCGSGALIAETAVYGWDTITSSAVPGVTKCLAMWGTNYPESGPLRWPAMREQVRAGMKLIVIDPRRTKAAEAADLHLALRPRTDGAMALGWIHVLIEEDLFDHEFVDRWCLGFDEVRAIAAEWTPQRTSDITGVDAEPYVAAARMYAANRPARLTFGVASTQIGEGAARSALLGQAILRAITGNLDRKGGEAFYDAPYQMLDYLPNVGFPGLIDHPDRTRDNVNAGDVPCSSVAGYTKFRQAMQRVHPEGHTAAQYLVFASQPHVYRAVLEQDPYPIRAIIVQCGEPLLNYGGARMAHQALTSDELELLVVMDLWQTPTAQLADYVLPAADFLERPDLNMTWGLTGEMFSVGQQVVEPLYDRHNDYELWAGLGRRVLNPDEWPERIEAVMDRFLAPSGRSFQEWADGPQNWYRPERQGWQSYEARGFATRSGKVELIPSLLAKLGIDPRPVYTGPPYARPDVDNEEEYPLRMITGSRVASLQGCTLRQARRLHALHPEPRVDIHPDTARAYGIGDGDWISIERPEGAIRQRARLTEGIEPLTINPAGYWWEPTRKPGPDLSGVWEANANAITPSDPALSSFAGDQPLRGLRCRIRRTT